MYGLREVELETPTLLGLVKEQKVECGQLRMV